MYETDNFFPGCALSNTTKRPMGDLIFSFPISEPMTILHMDIYAVGTEFNFEGNKHHLTTCCGMTTFAISEPTVKQNAKSFASAIMKILTLFGFSHTIVADKDSKFQGVFKETAELLGINMHVLSGENHDPMLIDRVNRFPDNILQ